MSYRPRTTILSDNRLVVILAAAVAAWPVLTAVLYLTGLGFVTLSELAAWVIQ